jgi:hypothetical protein
MGMVMDFKNRRFLKPLMPDVGHVLMISGLGHHSERR